MTAVDRPIYIEQGATFTMGFNWYRESPPNSGTQVPYDLTGCIARMQIRKSQQVAPIVDALSTGGAPMIVLGTVDGRFDIKIPATATSLLATRSALYDLEVEMTNGDVHRLLKGVVTVDPSITQAVAEPVVT